MSNTPENSEGFLHEHRKELTIGGVAALGTIGLIFALARQRLHEQAAKTLPPEDSAPESPSDNS